MRPTASLFVALLCCAVTLPLTSPRAQDDATAVDRLLAELDVEQKVAQLMLCWSLTRSDPDYPRGAELRQWIEEPGIGGVILSLGDVDTAAELVAELQDRARIPLLFAGDFETGLTFRLDGATDLGKQMLWGATGSSALARAAGAVTAREARALGFHWCYAPVLDVNSDPRNPIINVRSFGEDPALVARLGAAFVTGCQNAGVIATGKHFPGHGDVDTDSHVALPVVPGDRASLDALEFVPFRAAIAAGVQSIMTGHLSVPGLGVDPAVPATLAPEVLTGILRDEFGFDGLLTTDALDMGALEDSQDAAVRALLAGADVLLMPDDPPATCAAVAAAVRSGRLPRARLDAACRRVLLAKQRAGLLDGGGLPRPDWRDTVRSAAHRDVAAELARRGATLCRDPQGLVPLAAGGRLLLVVLAPDADLGAGTTVRTALAERPDTELTGHVLDASTGATERTAAVAAVAAAAAAGDTVVSLVFDRADRRRRPLRGLDDILAALRPVERHVAVVFGDPYALDHSHPRASVLCTYHGSADTERSVAAALLGAGPLVGRMPVSVPGHAALGDGATRLPPTPPTLPVVAPGLEGFAADLAARLRARLEQAVADRACPGAVVQVARRGRVVAHVAAGRHTYAADAPPTTPEARFDLASLTKVCATTPVALRLIERGALALDDRVAELVAGFGGGDKDAVTVRHLLTHTAGLPPFRRFYADHAGAHDVLAAACASELDNPPGAVYRYSDIGMMLLMLCCERAGGLPFAQLCAREVFEPLGMRRATFACGTTPVADAVPTERCAWRGRVVQGRVHDENAFALGGVSGHAGLFATADDVTRLAQAFLGGGRGWLRPATVRRATRRAELVPDSDRALGWGLYTPGGSGGSKLSPGSFGHTGFTGTSVWCDPRRDLSIVLLTNRVHPTRDNRGHLALRRDVADLVVDALRDDVPGEPR